MSVKITELQRKEYDTDKMQKRDFKGVWIPKKLWLNRDLSPIEKFLLVEIDSYEECYAKNKHFALELGISPSRVSHIISDLSKRDYLNVTLIYKPNSKEVDKRIIRISHAYSDIDRPIAKNATGSDEAKPLKDTAEQESEGVAKIARGYSQKQLGGGCENSLDKKPKSFKLPNEDNINNNNVKNITGAANKKSKPTKPISFDRWPYDPSPEVWADFLEVRKGKRARLTQTAVNLMAKQVHRGCQNGMTVDDCVATCCERNWTTFKYEWTDQFKQTQQSSQTQTRSTSMADRIESSWADEMQISKSNQSW